MENRLCLNKKPKYELPDEVAVGSYNYSKNKKRYNKPDFEPDLCIGAFGKGCLGKIYKPKSVSTEIWIKTSNKDLLDFIKKYNFDKEKTNTNTGKRGISLGEFKKIILEEFYGVKYGE